ncbi:MAG: twitch domain-containing radical SAM protein [Rhizobacter sp.]|nr:twitch domain-containing radical SAM protein [Bacteriovorax sp.]
MHGDSIMDEYNETKKKLDSVSASFCLAKWYQVTLHLQNGNNHSCHHPNTHQPTLAELKADPSALHNTAFKKNIRKLMLKGVRPKECEYCWKIEDTPGEHYSDRHIKSNDAWAKPYFEEALKAGGKDNVNPKYLEVSFSNSCNFKCSYCLPHISSSWMKELKQFGNYDTQSAHHAYPREDKMPIQDSENNPYVKTFWEWWPSLYQDLKVLRITGGEPLLVPDTFKVLEYVATHPNKDLSLAINTNLGVDQKFVNKAVTSIKKILQSEHLKDITLYTSLDTWGPQAEYIRFGLNLELFKSNLFHVLDSIPDIKIAFMCTYNLLSVTEFRQFLEFILEIKNKYTNPKNPHESRIILDISYLKDPHFMCANLVDTNLLDSMKSDLNFMKANSDSFKNGKSIGFNDYELNKMERLVGFAAIGVEPNFKKMQLSDLYKFFSEYDRRRKTNFEKLFPRYLEMYYQGKSYVEEKLLSKQADIS